MNQPHPGNPEMPELGRAGSPQRNPITMRPCSDRNWFLCKNLTPFLEHESWIEASARHKWAVTHDQQQGWPGATQNPAEVSGLPLQREAPSLVSLTTLKCGCGECSCWIRWEPRDRSALWQSLIMHSWALGVQKCIRHPLRYWEIRHLTI